MNKDRNQEAGSRKQGWNQAVEILRARERLAPGPSFHRCFLLPASCFLTGYFLIVIFRVIGDPFTSRRYA